MSTQPTFTNTLFDFSKFDNEGIHEALVGMSGGVDSTAVAVALQMHGLAVTGGTLLLRKDPPIPDKNAISTIKKIAKSLSIKHVFIDACDSFESQVITYFAKSYTKGLTPNPCIMCNPNVKIKNMIEAAQKLDIETVVTGHYASIYKDEHNQYRIRRAQDLKKDQSYFLYRLTQSELSKLSFPLGSVSSKAEVKAFTDKLNLKVSKSRESQDACFLDNVDRFDLIHTFSSQSLTPGNILNLKGEVVGVHDGIAKYTVGQRKGIGVAGPEPYYVLKIDATTNSIIIGTRENLERHTIYVKDVILHDLNLEDTFHALTKIRYNMEPIMCKVTRIEQSRYKIESEKPLYGVSPGQSAVWYLEDTLLGGGIIT